MALCEAQNHKNNKFSFLIRKVNPYFELLAEKAAAVHPRFDVPDFVTDGTGKPDE